MKAALVRRSPQARHLPADPFFRTFDRFFADDFFRPFALFAGGAPQRTEESSWVPVVDVRESEEAYQVSAELPGLTRDEVDVTLEENVLTLSGERKLEETAEGDSYRRMERAYGSFSRSFHLPAQVDEGGVRAQFKDGVLTVAVPKAEQAKPRKIDIQ